MNKLLNCFTNELKMEINANDEKENNEVCCTFIRSESSFLETNNGNTFAMGTPGAQID